MRKISISVIFLLVFLSSFNNKNPMTFEKYSEKISTIDLPFKVNCDNNLIGSDFGFSDSIRNKYAGIAFARIYGKLPYNEKYTGIIYLFAQDIDLPILKITDKKGKEISSLALVMEPCGTYGPDGFTFSWCEITSDLKIKQKDSSSTYNRDTLGNIIESSIKSKVTFTTYEIDNNGYLKMVQ